LVYYVTNGECCYYRYFQVLKVVNLKNGPPTKLRRKHCSDVKRKKLKTHWGPAGTPLGYKWGMLLFSLYSGSEGCKFENYSFRNPKTII
jgi:hypothetical protein